MAAAAGFIRRLCKYSSTRKFGIALIVLIQFSFLTFIALQVFTLSQYYDSTPTKNVLAPRDVTVSRRQQEVTECMSADPGYADSGVWTLYDGTGHRLEPVGRWIIEPRMLPPAAKQQLSGEVRSTTLLILVVSAAQNVERRDAIRATWANVDLMTSLGARVVFLLGRVEAPSEVARNVTEEVERCGDILQLNTTEVRDNLMLKVIGALRWVLRRRHCETVGYRDESAATRQRMLTSLRYVMKTDDDSYVNVALLLPRLDAEDEKTAKMRRTAAAANASAPIGFIYGVVSDVMVLPEDRRCLPASLQNKTLRTLPKFASGVGYAMPIDVARFIVELDERRQLSPMTARRPCGCREDCVITGILLMGIDGLRHVNDPSFCSYYDLVYSLLWDMDVLNKIDAELRNISAAANVINSPNESAACLIQYAPVLHAVKSPEHFVAIWKLLATAAEAGLRCSTLGPNDKFCFEAMRAAVNAGKKASTPVHATQHL